MLQGEWRGRPTEEQRLEALPGSSLLAIPGQDRLRALPALLLYLAVISPLIALIVISALVSHHSAQHPTPIVSSTLRASLGNEAMIFGYIVLASWMMSLMEGRSVTDYGLRRPGLPRSAPGALWGILGLSILVLGLRLSHHMAVEPTALHGLRAVYYAVGWACMFVTVGLFEEFFFRGYLQVALARCFAQLYAAVRRDDRGRDGFGFWAAAVVISFGFGLVHRSNPGESPLGLLAAGVAGLTFAYSLWRTGSLWWAIGFHAAWDWTQSFVFGAADSGTLIREHLLTSNAVGVPVLSGGITGPEGSVLVFPVLALIALVIRTTLPPSRALRERAALQRSGAQTVDSASA